jgi:hypothetical protein
MRLPLTALAGAGVALLLTACAPPGPGSLTGLPRTVQAPFPDEGAHRDVVAVRRVVVAALSAEVDAFRIRNGGSTRLPAAQRVAEVAEFEAPTLAARARYDPVMGPIDRYVEATFRPTRWDGVAVRGNTAKAYVIGHDELFMLDGGLRRDASWQYQLLLRRGADGRWTVVAEQALGDEQVRAIDAPRSSAGGAP